jgi:hypothetical protein
MAETNPLGGNMNTPSSSGHGSTGAANASYAAAAFPKELHKPVRPLPWYIRMITVLEGSRPFRLGLFAVSASLLAVWGYYDFRDANNIIKRMEEKRIDKEVKETLARKVARKERKRQEKLQRRIDQETAKSADSEAEG